MSANVTVQATFMPSINGPYNVIIQKEGSGTVTCSPDLDAYPSGTSVNLTATPDGGWTFTGWGGDLSGTANPVIINIDSNKLIKAHFAQPSAGGSTNWWSSAWSRRVPVSVTETSGVMALANYQVRLHVTYDADMQPDFRDVRFIDPASQFELPYWCESFSANASADFWLKVPYISSSGAANIFMYYGNASCVTASNIHSTFIWGDDFQDAAWTDANFHQVNYNGTAGQPSEQYVTGEGTYEQKGLVKSEPIGELYSGGALLTLPPNYIVEIELNPVIDTGDTIICPRYEAVFDKYEALVNMKFDSTGLNKVLNNNWAYLAGASMLPKQVDPGAWYKMLTIVTRQGSLNRIRILVDGVQYIDATDPSLSYTGLALITYDALDGFDVYYDNFIVRQYAEVEPTAATGAEEKYVAPAPGNPVVPVSGPTGGGGGGGGPVRTTSPKVFKSTGGDIVVNIAAGTMFLNKAGSSASYVGFTKLAVADWPAAPAGMSILSAVYKLTPAGGTFDPPARLTFSCDKKLLPEGLDLETMVIASWDGQTGRWTTLDGLAVDTSAGTVTAKIDKLSTFAVMAATRPADFTVSSLAISPATVMAGGTATFKVSVNNSGDLGGSYRVVLKIGDVEKDKKDVTIAGGATQTVSFTETMSAPGEYPVDINGLSGTINVQEPQPPPGQTTPAAASFSVGRISVTPDRVTAGDSVTVEVEVANSGDLGGDYQVALKLDGQPEDVRKLTIAGGGTGVLEFEVQVPAAGQHTLEVNGLSRILMAAAKPAPVVPPVSETPAVAAQTPKSTVNFWPIGVIAAVVVIGLVVGIAATRRRMR